jgi:putative tryptophan/tyrosine transport system substrate-binding protein
MQFDQLKRRDFITLLGSAAVAWPLAARAQQPAMPVIGFLDPESLEPTAPLVAAFRNGLSETGHVEGRNVAIEFRWAYNDRDRLPDLAADLVRRRVTVIATPGGIAATLVAKAATATIPIVFMVSGDPVQAGLAMSLSRPGGNTTGVSFMTGEIAAKQLGLMHELIPRAERFAVLVNPKNPNAEPLTRDVQAAALAIGRQIEVLAATTNRDIDAAFSSLAQKRADALLVSPDPLFTARRAQLVILATHHRLPAVYFDRVLTDIGGLMSYGANLAEQYRQVGVYVGRILKGEKSADLPVIRPTKLEFVINLQTARTLGIDVPPTLLATADEVIE